MLIRVRLFALARKQTGLAEVEIDLPEEATVADLKARLGSKCPQLLPLLPNVMIAVDAEYATDDQVVPLDAEVAVIPPVSGGGPLP